MINVAMLSYWHVHAKDYAKQAEAHPNTEIVAVWDEKPERGKIEAEHRKVKFYADLEDLLSQSDIDGVIVDTPTNMHHDVIVKSANAGKHIFTEKVVALTLKEFNDCLTAVEKNGVKLTVSLPRLNDSYTLAIQNILAKGWLGELTQARVRLSHGGAVAGWLPEHFYNLEQCGGGALIDLGCHPMYLTRLFLGMPESVNAHYGYMIGKEVEDNAVSVLNYPNGALGIVEAGFVNPFSPFSIELHGTDGSLLYGFPADLLQYRTNKLGEEAAKTWHTQSLPEKNPSSFQQWVDHIKNNTIAHDNIRLARDLTKLMEASNLSALHHKPVRISKLVQ